MEISGLRSAMPFMFPGAEKDGAENVSHRLGDINDVHAPELLSDEEAIDVLNETVNMIGQDGAAALSVHSGLTESRVFSLLGL